MLATFTATPGGLKGYFFTEVNHLRALYWRFNIFVFDKGTIMRAVIQRVSRAGVSIEGEVYSSIGMGLLVFLGIEDADTYEDIEWLSAKIVNLRIFNDDAGVMNVSIKDCQGDLLLVSQFTLHALTKKGNRPSYIRASKPDVAVPLYEHMVKKLTADLGKPVKTGQFGADMRVELLNEGPVTIIIDTKQRE